MRVYGSWADKQDTLVKNVSMDLAKYLLGILACDQPNFDADYYAIGEDIPNDITTFNELFGIYDLDDLAKEPQSQVH